MKAYLYFNKSDRRYINKNIEVIQPSNSINDYIDIEFIDDTTIEKPTFKLSTQTNLLQANYMFIPDLGRYYYIDNTTLSRGHLYCECSVDVLMSYKDEILNTSVSLLRQQNQYNMYLPDDSLPIIQPTNVRTINFNKSFNNAVDFVLVIAGGL